MWILVYGSSYPYLITPTPNLPIIYVLYVRLCVYLAQIRTFTKRINLWKYAHHLPFNVLCKMPVLRLPYSHGCEGGRLELIPVGVLNRLLFVEVFISAKQTYTHTRNKGGRERGRGGGRRRERERGRENTYAHFSICL